MTEERYNLIDDEWIGLEGAEYLTAIEDSKNIKKTVYFAYNKNAKGICDLLNKLDKECNELDSHSMFLHDNLERLGNRNRELENKIKKLENSKQSNDYSALNEYRAMVHSILQSTYDEIYKNGHGMNNLGFIDFAKKFGYDIKFRKW